MGKKIEIPDEQFEKFEERAPEKGFDSGEEYVNYVLEQVYDRLVGQEESQQEEYSEEEERKVRDRLRRLGYLD